MSAAIVILASSSTHAQDLKSQLAGAYTLSSVYEELADGKKYDTWGWGEGVQGSAIYTSSGVFSLQIMGANRHDNPGQGPRDPIGPMVAYFGTHMVDAAAKTISYHIDRSSFPGWSDFDRKSTVVGIGNGRLETAAPIKGDPKLGDFVAHLVWKRVGTE